MFSNKFPSEDSAMWLFNKKIHFHLMRKKKLKIKDNLENKFFQRASLSLLMKEFFVFLSLLMKEFLLFCTSLDNKFIQRACGVFSCGGKGNTVLAKMLIRFQSKGMLQVSDAAGSDKGDAGRNRGQSGTIATMEGGDVIQKLSDQRKTSEPWRAVARESPNAIMPNMDSANHGNSPTITIIDDTFLLGYHNVDHPLLNPCLVPLLISEVSFDIHTEEIDRDLRKFDLPSSNNDTSTLSNKLKTPLTDTHTPNIPQPHNPYHTSNPAPLNNLTTLDVPNPTPPNTLTAPDVTNQAPSSPAIPNPTPPSLNTTSRPTWKRILKADVKQKTCQVASCGTKRALPYDKHQSELPIKRSVVSQVDEEQIQILAEAGSQKQ